MDSEMCGDKYEPVVSLQVYLERIIDLRFSAMKEEVLEARRLMEKTMDGFPEQFVKKGQIDVVTAELKANVKTLVKQVSNLESMKSEIIGKLWSIGILGAGLIIILEVLFRYLVNK